MINAVRSWKGQFGSVSSARLQRLDGEHVDNIPSCNCKCGWDQNHLAVFGCEKLDMESFSDDDEPEPRLSPRRSERLCAK